MASKYLSLTRGDTHVWGLTKTDFHEPQMTRLIGIGTFKTTTSGLEFSPTRSYRLGEHKVLLHRTTTKHSDSIQSVAANFAV